MKGKWTLGPWEVGGNTGFINQIKIEPCIGIAYGAGAEQEANSRLIASAPDMIEALIWFVKRCKAGEVRSTTTQAHYIDIIEKATGMTIEEVMEE
jgi:hypothetical protein